MCGIVAMVDANNYGFSQADSETFFGMMLLNSFRGAHSTGTFGASRNNQVDILKSIHDPYRWARWELATEFMTRMDKRYWCVVGHGRYATQGGIVAKNAHPFLHKQITLVHNGTISNFHELKKEHKVSYEVDSELICYLIAEYGLKATLAQIRGPYALLYYDSDEGTFNVTRNYERPLEWAQGYNDDRISFASERHVLKWAGDKGATLRNFATVPAMEHWVYTQDAGKLKKEVISLVPKASPIKTFFHGGTNRASHPMHSYWGLDEDTHDETLWIGNRQFEEGSAVRFSVTSMIGGEHDTDKTPFVNVKGVALVDKTVEIIYHHSGDESNFMDTFSEDNSEMILIGEITKFTRTHADPRFNYRVFVKDVKEFKQPSSQLPAIILPPVSQKTQKDLMARIQEATEAEAAAKEKEPPEKKENVIALPQRISFKLLNGESITAKRFKTFAALGCVMCGEHPTIEEAEKTLIDVNPKTKAWELHCNSCLAHFDFDVNNARVRQ